MTWIVAAIAATCAFVLGWLVRGAAEEWREQPTWPMPLSTVQHRLVRERLDEIRNWRPAA